MQSSVRQWFERLDYLDVVLWLFRIVLIASIIWGTGATIRSGKYGLETWMSFMGFGLAQGSLYARAICVPKRYVL